MGQMGHDETPTLVVNFNQKQSCQTVIPKMAFKLVCCHRLRLLEFLIFAITLICQLNIANGNLNQQVHRRFEYKYSFKPPYLAQRDGTVPFWEYGGSKCIVFF